MSQGCYRSLSETPPSVWELWKSRLASTPHPQTPPGQVCLATHHSFIHSSSVSHEGFCPAAPRRRALPRCGMLTGTISLARTPDSYAALLRLYEPMAKASCSSLVMLAFLAVFSAQFPCEEQKKPKANQKARERCSCFRWRQNKTTFLKKQHSENAS